MSLRNPGRFRTNFSESLPGETRAVIPQKPRALRNPKAAAIPRSENRRMGGEMGITLATSAVPVERAAATAKQAIGGGTDEEPTTAFASSRRVRNGNADPIPLAKWRTANVAKTPPVTLAVVCIGRTVVPRSFGA